MSDSKKMSSPYVVLENRPLDQWKVTELKEELKRRKLATKGLKEELVKRLDEAVRAEIAEADENLDNGLKNVDQPDNPTDDVEVEPTDTEKVISNTDHLSDENESLEKDNMTEKLDTNESLEKKIITEKLDSNECLEKDNMTEKLDSNESLEKDNMTEKVNSNESVEKDNITEKLDSNESVEKDNITEKLDSNESLEKNNMTEKLDSNVSLERENTTEKLDSNEGLGKESMTEKLDNENNDGLQSLAEKAVPEGEDGTVCKGIEGFQAVQEISVGTAVIGNEGMVSEDLQKVETNNKDGVSNPQSKEEVKPDSSDVSSQVVEVSQVKSDSISIDSMSITEKNELKDNTVIADDVKLELDVKPEMVQSSSSKVVKTESVVVDEDMVTAEEKDVNIAETVEICKKNDSGDIGSPEKLNLDRSSGDDSMEEDALESKQIDSKFTSQDISEKVEAPLVKEDDSVDVMVVDIPADKNDKSDLAGASTKRKLHDQEGAANNDVIKRQRRWNSEGLKVPEPQTTNPSASTTPKDGLQTSLRRSFSRSDSSVSNEAPKERVVPPSLKPPTTSLRIDRFLRPFTLKAVQELLGKSGTVVSFWMDHIKTHCYVTYSSVEEAMETRNALYNLQWPANGGRLLVADFVDPSEVKSRIEAPLPSPPTPVSTPTPTTPQPPPAAMQPPRQQLPPPPPLPLPPPPPLSLPPSSREPALPPPPPLPEKVEPPIVTLDDLFRKTRATPRIYYLPLSDEEVAAKVKGEGRNAKQ